MPGTVDIHRVSSAPPEWVYRAFLSPEAIAKRNAPHGFVARVESFDARERGGYRMSFVNFTTGTSHRFEGRCLELSPKERIVVSDRQHSGRPPSGPGATAMLTPALSNGHEVPWRREWSSNPFERRVRRWP